MANNRMWLVHKQAKVGVMLGKRFGSGWYVGEWLTPDSLKLGRDLEALYKYVYENPEWDWDGFVLLQELDETPKWRYGGLNDKGFREFEFLEEEVESGTK